jgi:aerobic carbon-monoxide dehydrogenase small subunit
MILAALHLLSKNPQPSREEIGEALSGNLCRCTGYTQIFESVAEAARRSTGR